MLQGRAIPTLPRILIVTVLVALIAFVAGVQLGGRPASGPTLAAAAPSASVAAPTRSQSATVTPTSTASPVFAIADASSFALGFRPEAVIAGLAGGATCATGAPVAPGFTTAAASRTLVRAWLTSCPLAANRRASFLNDLMRALEHDIPTSVSDLTRGYKGMTLVYYLYEDGPFSGTVVMTVNGSGRDLVIEITLEEGPSQS